MSDITGSISSKGEPAPSADGDPRRAVELYGEHYRANPKNPEAALAYGQAISCSASGGAAVFRPPRRGNFLLVPADQTRVALDQLRVLVRCVRPRLKPVLKLERG